jgi:hypothetical protein
MAEPCYISYIHFISWFSLMSNFVLIVLAWQVTTRSFTWQDYVQYSSRIHVIMRTCWCCMSKKGQISRTPYIVSEPNLQVYFKLYDWNSIMKVVVTISKPHKVPISETKVNLSHFDTFRHALWHSWYNCSSFKHLWLWIYMVQQHLAFVSDVYVTESK